MKKLLLIIVLSCIFQFSFAQAGRVKWTRIQEIPLVSIYSIKNIDGEIYAGGENNVFFTKSNIKEWHSAPVLSPRPYGIDDIFKMKNKLYLTGYNQGIFESGDNGKNWKPANNGLPSKTPVEFAARNGSLYVATNDQGVYRLNNASGNWEAFNDGLHSGTTFSFDCIANTDSCLIGGVGANGMLPIRRDHDGNWKLNDFTRFFHTSDVMQAGKNIWAFTSNKPMVSEDYGKSWVTVGNGIRRGYGSKALQIGDSLYTTVHFMGNNVILYRRGLNETFTEPWTPVDTLRDHYCFGMTYANKKLYIATHKGVLFTDLSASGSDELRPFLVFPNPANDFIRVINGASIGAIKFLIYNANGVVVLSEQVRSDEEIFHISKIKAGLYFYSLAGPSGKIRTGSIVIDR